MLNTDPPNVAGVQFHLLRIKADARKYLKDLFKKKRTAATHVLVIMVSDEKRNHKPYAIPVKYVPYKSLRDQFIRDLIVDVKEVMVSLGLQVVGEFTIPTHSLLLLS